METHTETAPPPADVHALRRRAALHELVELLVLRQRAVALGVGAVVVLGLLLTVLAPGLVPSTALAGAVVGVLALAAGAALAFVVHRQDPVLRAPGQARWDGSRVLAWVPTLEQDAMPPVVGVVAERIATYGRHRLLVVDGGAGARESATAIGLAAADDGARTLLVDLTDASPQPGMAAVGDGETSLADAATIDAERHFATVGAGRRLADSVAATKALLERPKRDLDLLLVVAPDDEDARRALLPAVDRVVVCVTAGARQRSAVRDRLAGFESVAPTELLLVGGHLTDLAPGVERPRPQADEVPPRSADATPPQVAVVEGDPAGATPPPEPPADTPPPPPAGARRASAPAVPPPSSPPPTSGPRPSSSPAHSDGPTGPTGSGGRSSGVAVLTRPSAVASRDRSERVPVPTARSVWQFRSFRAGERTTGPTRTAARGDRGRVAAEDRLVVTQPVDAPAEGPAQVEATVAEATVAETTVDETTADETAANVATGTEAPAVAARADDGAPDDAADDDTNVASGDPEVRDVPDGTTDVEPRGHDEGTDDLLDLDATDDLYTSATLEFLAGGDGGRST